MINPPRQPRVYPSPIPIQLSKILLVEGDGPLHFFEALLKQLGLNGGIEVHDFRGTQDLPKYLKTLVATPGFGSVKSVAIIRDAENQSVQDVVNSLQYAVAAVNLPATVRRGWFILPDNNGPGMIETLLMDAARREPGLAPLCDCVDAFFDCVKKHQTAIPTAKHLAQAFLSTRDEVQLPLGITAARGYWPWDSQAFDPLKQFLRSI